MSKINAVIFDLDNTLIDRKLAFKVYADQFADAFLQFAGDAEKENIINHIISADQNGYRSKRELYGEILATFDMQDKRTSIDDMLQYWYSEFSKCTVLMDGAREILDYLKSRKIKLGIITNGSVHQHAKIDQVDIRDYFHTILVSDEVKMKKPDVRIFHLALEHLDQPADRTLFVGDHPVNDVTGALESGMHAVWLKGFMDWEGRVPQPLIAINKLFELQKLIV